LLNLPLPTEAPLWLWCQAKQGRQNHAKQILASGQSSAGEGTQPSGYERPRSKNYKLVWWIKKYLPESK